MTSDFGVFLLLQFSLQIDMIRQKLEFDAQKIRSVMEERFGTSDEVVHRTQVSLINSVSLITTERSQTLDIDISIVL